MTGLLGMLIAAALGCRVEGTLRSSDGLERIPDVMVEDLSGRALTRSDSSGQYALDLESGGVHAIRLSRIGFAERRVDVMLNCTEPVRLDVLLAPAATRLPAVAVEGGDSAGTGPADRDAPLAIGARRVTGSGLHANPLLANPDVLAALTTSADVIASPESPTGLRVRGGSGDQNLVELDGVPLYNAMHAAGTLTAINPDAIGSAALYAGVPPARLGGALSSVISLETREWFPTRLETQGAIDATAVRQMVTGPLPWARSSFLLSARTTTHDLLGSGNQTDQTSSHFGDYLGRLIVPIRGGSLELLLIGGDDRLSFDARVDSEPPASPASASSPLALAQGSPRRNAFDWSTGTQALVWRSSYFSPTTWQARAWRNTFGASADWGAPGTKTLTSGLASMGIGGSVTRPLGSTTLELGLDAEHLATAYRSLPPLSVGNVLASGQGIALASARSQLSAFIEDRWRWRDRWDGALGVRGVAVLGRGVVSEPRATVRYALAPSMSLWSGYARTHQFTQSLRNEESFLDAVVGVSFPAMAGTRGVPTAQADQITVGLSTQLGARTSATVEAYTRRMKSLLLVAPIAGDPFAITGYAVGEGSAEGATISLHHDGRLSADATYGLARSSRTVPALSYHPAALPEQTLNAGVAYHIGPSTTLRSAALVSSGRRTSLLGDVVEWSTYNMFSPGDLAGSPGRVLGILDGHRLPAYARVDVGIRHVWRVHLLGPSTSLAGTATVYNALGRTNVLDLYQVSRLSGQRDLLMLPRSFTAGVEWRY